MIKKKSIHILFVIVALTLFISACAHRDCQGRKKTAKTEMGGWL